MKNALILHGTNGDHNKNWLPWLESELKKKGFKTWTPDLPRADKPNIRRYNDYILPQWKFSNDSIIVGHSSGAVAILGLLQDLPDDFSIDKVILVAGFTDDLGWESLNELFLIPFDWQKIKKHARKIILIHSDNDPYVPIWHGEKLRDLLNAELIVFPKQKHFSMSNDPRYNKFPRLLEIILQH